MREVSGKVAFVTGGASGIGLGLVRTFLAAGMKVAVADLRADHLEETQRLLEGSGDFQLLTVDVADRASVAEAARETLRRFGKVHVICNNAGVGTPVPLEQTTYEDWDWVMGVNLGGVINGVQTFLPHLIAQGEGGHFVNTSSMAGILPTANNVIYAASKFGVWGLTESLRLTLAPHDIGATVLFPGLTRSRMPLAEENRPARFRTAAPRALQTPAPIAVDPNAGMDPLGIGAMVLDAIRSNQPYVLSHQEFKEELRAHFDEILSASPAGQQIDPGRLALEAARRAQTAQARARIQQSTR